MTLIVEAPASYEPERRYILDVVLSDWLGLDWRLVATPGPAVRIRVAGEPRGRCVTVPDGLFGVDPGAWLTVASLPSTPLAHGSVDEAGAAALPRGGVPIIYGDEPPARTALITGGGDGARVHLDVFGSAFFMLTRYEEIAIATRDGYGRFPASSSLAARERFLEWPIVDAYVELLWSALQRVWPRLRRRPREFRLVLTHDVDDPLASMGRGPARIARQFAGDLVLRRDIALAARRARSLPAARRGDHRLDPHNTFDFLMDVSEGNGVRSAFYFLANRRVDPRASEYYVPDHPFIRRLIRQIDRRGHEVGFHAGFDTYLDPALTKAEFERLRSVAESEGAGPDSWGGRQHFLRWANPVTWRNWSDAGLSYDATLAYAEAVGFRTGTCQEYRVFDLERRRRLDLVERPFQVMDVTLFAYMRLSREAAFTVVMDVAAQCRRYRGSLGILWHNSELLRTATEQDWYASLVGAVNASA